TLRLAHPPPLSLHDALPISPLERTAAPARSRCRSAARRSIVVSSQWLPWSRVQTGREITLPLPGHVECSSAAMPIGCNATPSARSEEHTSELQSRVDLVCRL